MQDFVHQQYDYILYHLSLKASGKNTGHPHPATSFVLHEFLKRQGEVFFCVEASPVSAQKKTIHSCYNVDIINLKDL